MAITHVVSTSTGGNSSLTTSAVDTTGANLLIASCNRYSGGGSGAFTISDSKGNTWTALTGVTSSGTADTLQWWYAKNATVGSGHTVTFTKGSGSPFAAVVFSAFAGADTTSPLDQQNTLNDNGSSSTHTAASVTPTTNGQLIVQTLSTDGANYSSINSSYSLAAKVDWAGGVKVTAAVAYLIQGTAGASAPTITLDASAGAGIGTATFKAAAAATSQIKSRDGVTQATISSGNGVAIASIKSWNGVANT